MEEKEKTPTELVMPEHQLPEQPATRAEDRQGHRAELHAAEEED